MVLVLAARAIEGSGGPGVAARGGGRSPRLAAKTVDFFLRRRAVEPVEAFQAVRLEPQFEGYGTPARELARAGKRLRACLRAL